jgi:hypothetical protein
MSYGPEFDYLPIGDDYPSDDWYAREYPDDPQVGGDADLGDHDSC